MPLIQWAETTKITSIQLSDLTCLMDREAHWSLIGSLAMAAVIISYTMRSMQAVFSAVCMLEPVEIVRHGPLWFGMGLRWRVVNHPSIHFECRPFARIPSEKGHAGFGE